MYNKKHYEENKQQYLEKNRKHRSAKRAWYKALKEESECEVCGMNVTCCLEFHHTSGKKETNLSEAVHNCWSIERMLKEMEKCIIVCANCHKKIHADVVVNW